MSELSNATAARTRSETGKRGRDLTARMEFVVEMDEKPIMYIFERPLSTLRQKKVTVPISDARPHRDYISLNREGFILARHESKVSNFHDPEEIARVHLPEIERLMMEVTDSSHAV